MSQKRQTEVLNRRGQAAAQITALAQDYPASHRIPWHFHEWDQLVYASHGVMTVSTDEGSWMVPTHRAVWIPAGVPHTIAMSGTVAMRTLYLKPALGKCRPCVCSVVNVPPLLRELILHVCSLRILKRTLPSHLHLANVIRSQLQTIQSVPLQLPNPSDPRAKRLAEALIQRPSDRRAFKQLCKMTGASKRTLERVFRRETGMSLGRWRRQMRLMHAMRLLAEGEKVTHAALEAGYSTPSAFIAMFGKILGATPAAYFRGGRVQAPTP